MLWSSGASAGRQWVVRHALRSLVKQAVPSTQPTAHTVMGFAVNRLDEIVSALGERGVIWERFAGFPHDERGVVITPDRAKVVWFRDPDGNLLSIVEFSR